VFSPFGLSLSKASRETLRAVRQAHRERIRIPGRVLAGRPASHWPTG
jgi:hypothetical protein